MASGRSTNPALSEDEVKRAHNAIACLASLPLESLTGGTSRPNTLSNPNVSKGMDI